MSRPSSAAHRLRDPARYPMLDGVAAEAMQCVVGAAGRVASSRRGADSPDGDSSPSDAATAPPRPTARVRPSSAKRLATDASLRVMAATQRLDLEILGFDACAVAIRAPAVAALSTQAPVRPPPTVPRTAPSEAGRIKRGGMAARHDPNPPIRRQEPYHQVPAAILRRRIAAEDEAAARQLRSYVESELACESAAIRRETRVSSESMRLAVFIWSQTTVHAKFANVLLDALRQSRATSIFSTVFRRHLLHYVHRRKLLRKRAAWENQELKSVAPLTQAMLSKCLPHLAVIPLSRRETLIAQCRPRVFCAGGYVCFSNAHAESPFRSAAAATSGSTGTKGPYQPRSSTKGIGATPANRLPPFAHRNADRNNNSFNAAASLAGDSSAAALHSEDTSAIDTLIFNAREWATGGLFGDADATVARPTASADAAEVETLRKRRACEASLFLIVKGAVHVWFRSTEDRHGVLFRSRVKESIDASTGGAVGLEILMGLDARSYVAVAQTDVHAYEVKLTDVFEALHPKAAVLSTLAIKSDGETTEGANANGGSQPPSAGATSNANVKAATSVGGLTAEGTHGVASVVEDAIAELARECRRRVILQSPLTVSFVRQSPFFAEWSTDGLQRLINVARPMTVSEGELLPLHHVRASRVGSDAPGGEFRSSSGPGGVDRRASTIGAAAGAPLNAARAGSAKAREGTTTHAPTVDRMYIVQHGVIAAERPTTSGHGAKPEIFRTGSTLGVHACFSVHRTLVSQMPVYRALAPSDVWVVHRQDLVDTAAHEPLGAMLEALVGIHAAATRNVIPAW